MPKFEYDDYEREVEEELEDEDQLEELFSPSFSKISRFEEDDEWDE